jgi:hypothetical protein
MYVQLLLLLVLVLGAHVYYSATWVLSLKNVTVTFVHDSLKLKSTCIFFLPEIDLSL